MNGLLLAIGLIVGGACMHWSDASSVEQARAELAGLKATHSEALAASRTAALERIRQAEERADALQEKLNKAEERQSINQKEIQREITRNTTGRACLDGRTVGLLNSAAADRAAALPTPTSKPAAEDAATATDTDVATWANQAIGRYNVCRARLGALIDWFQPTTSPTLTPDEHPDD